MFSKLNVGKALWFGCIPLVKQLIGNVQWGSRYGFVFPCTLSHGSFPTVSLNSFTINIIFTNSDVWEPIYYGLSLLHLLLKNWLW